MAKFGELIKKPRTVIYFFDNYNSTLISDINPETVAPGINFLKIDINKNTELCDSLRIKTPTVLFYRNEQEIMRKTDLCTADLVDLCNLFFSVENEGDSIGDFLHKHFDIDIPDIIALGIEPHKYWRNTNVAELAKIATFLQLNIADLFR